MKESMHRKVALYSAVISVSLMSMSLMLALYIYEMAAIREMFFGGYLTDVGMGQVEWRDCDEACRFVLDRHHHDMEYIREMFAVVSDGASDIVRVSVLSAAISFLSIFFCLVSLGRIKSRWKEEVLLREE